MVYNESVIDHLVIFVNQGPDGSGNWTFSNTTVPLEGMSAGSSDLAWGDFDGDGDEDLAVGSNGSTVIFRNDAGTLAALPNELPGYDEDASYAAVYDLRSMTWADYDNDGDLDLLLPSVYDPATFSFTNALLRNDGADRSGPGGSGWLFTDAPSGIEPSPHAQSAWADEDGDGDLDLLLQSIDPNGKESFLKLFRNQPAGFTAEPLLDFSDLDGTVDWADADADGDLDLLVAGNLLDADQNYKTVLRIYRNDGAGGFTPITLHEGWDADWLDLPDRHLGRLRLRRRRRRPGHRQLHRQRRRSRATRRSTPTSGNTWSVAAARAAGADLLGRPRRRLHLARLRRRRRPRLPGRRRLLRAERQRPGRSQDQALPQRCAGPQPAAGGAYGLHAVAVRQTGRRALLERRPRRPHRGGAR